MLLDLLNKRTAVAKSYTKTFISEVKKCLEDYKCEKTDASERVHNKHVKSANRYDFVIPYIYSTHESILSSVFEKGAELVISDRGATDEAKALAIKAIYEYLRDKLDLDTFYSQSAWWYLLIGFTSSQQFFDVKISGEVPVNGQDGAPLLGDDGMPVTTPVYDWNDPRVKIDDPKKTYFAPDSEYTIDGKKVPYIITERLWDAKELEKMYEQEEGSIEATESLETGEDYKESEKNDDIKRAVCFYYKGKIPKSDSEEIIEYDPEAEYYITYTKSKILHIALNDKYNTLSRWFAPPTDFFGFGLGKTLRSAQKEMSIRRQQQIRYADLHAFPWLTVDSATKVDQRSLEDVTKRKPLVYSEKPPQYLVPPPIPQTLTDMDTMARSDAQFISGTLDLSKGAQESNTVKTATGQQLFAQSQDKRINKIRVELGAYFRQVVINLCKLARDNWEDEKVLQVAGDEGVQEVVINKELLNSIDFDTDIDIQLDTISVNKDTIAERSIALYDKVKDDPFVNRKKIFAKTLKDGYQIKNPESYILQPGEEGTQPTQEPISNEPVPEMGQEQTMGAEMAPDPNANPYV